MRLGTALTKLIIFLLKKTNLSLKDKSEILSHLLEKIGMFPTRSIINVENGQVYLKGKPATTEEILALKESANALLDNFSRKFVKDQMAFIALNLGIQKSTSLEQILFNKAALWIENEEDELYRKLANLDSYINIY